MKSHVEDEEMEDWVVNGNWLGPAVKTAGARSIGLVQKRNSLRKHTECVSLYAYFKHLLSRSVSVLRLCEVVPCRNGLRISAPEAEASLRIALYECASSELRNCIASLLIHGLIIPFWTRYRFRHIHNLFPSIVSAVSSTEWVGVWLGHAPRDMTREWI